MLIFEIKLKTTSYMLLFYEEIDILMPYATLEVHLLQLDLSHLSNKLV